MSMLAGSYDRRDDHSRRPDPREGSRLSRDHDHSHDPRHRDSHRERERDRGHERERDAHGREREREREKDGHRERDRDRDTRTSRDRKEHAEHRWRAFPCFNWALVCCLWVPELCELCSALIMLLAQAACTCIT